MVTTRTIPVRDIEAEIEEFGEGTRPFVLVHGYTGSKLDFVDHREGLGSLGRTVLVDQRGHGGTSNPGTPDEYRYEGLIADLEAVMDTLEIGEMDLLGHSLGGMTAMRYTLAHPERVSSLILMDTGPDPMPAQMDRAGREALIADGMASLLEMRKRTVNDLPRSPSTVDFEERIGTDAYWGRIETKLTAMDPVAFVELGELLNNARSVADDLAAITCPTTVLVGEEDTPFVEASERMAATIPDAELVVIPNAAHSPQNENPGHWFDAVAAHIERARASG